MGKSSVAQYHCVLPNCRFLGQIIQKWQIFIPHGQRHINGWDLTFGCETAINIGRTCFFFKYKDILSDILGSNVVKNPDPSLLSIHKYILKKDVEMVTKTTQITQIGRICCELAQF